MNINFSTDPLFSWYVVLLFLSGIILIALSAVKNDGQSTGMRILQAIVGLAFLGYGVYLGFIFEGGSYLIMFKAFIVPALLIFNFLRGRFRRLRASASSGAGPA